MLYGSVMESTAGVGCLRVHGRISWLDAQDIQPQPSTSNERRQRGEGSTDRVVRLCDGEHCRGGMPQGV